MTLSCCCCCPIAAPAAAAVEGGLGTLLKAMESQSAAALGPLLSAALAPQSPLRAFDLLGSVLLAEVDSALGTHVAGVAGGNMLGAGAGVGICWVFTWQVWWRGGMGQGY